MERDEDLAPGDLRVSCALVDASGEEVTPDSKTLGAVAAGHTMVLDREKLLREKPRAPKASLAFHDGSDRREIPVGAEPLAIGRDPQNDIVLDDRRVSRKHAEIRLRLGRYTLYYYGPERTIWCDASQDCNDLLPDRPALASHAPGCR